MNYEVASVHTQVSVWYQRAQIDYINHYMALYAAFNAWYREIAHTTNDRQALNYLRKRPILWSDYCSGKRLRTLISPMHYLVELTQREPLPYNSPHWKGEVAHSKDWDSLIEYWYRVRCLVMHGDAIRSVYVYLAYETLNIFMGEVIRQGNTEPRTKDCLQPLRNRL